MSFHIVFPVFSIGLASYLAVLNALHLLTRRPVFLDLFNYWKNIFAVAFGMGVVSGIVMSYQFGTNWSVFSDKVGPVLGPLMGYEVMSAFFLEAGFLGVMLFGTRARRPAAALLRDADGRARHLHLGVLDSGRQLAGCRRRPATRSTHEGQFVPVDWSKVMFNPSFPYRLVHMVLAAYLTTAFVVGAVGALHLLRDLANAARAADVLDGDGDGDGRRADPDRRRRCAWPQHAALSARQDRGAGGRFRDAPPRPADPVRLAQYGRERTDYAIEVPWLGSLILTHSLDGDARAEGVPAATSGRTRR